MGYYHAADRRLGTAGCISAIAKAMSKPPRIGIIATPRSRTSSMSAAAGATTPREIQVMRATAPDIYGSALTKAGVLSSLADNAAILASISAALSVRVLACSTAASSATRRRQLSPTRPHS